MAEKNNILIIENSFYEIKNIERQFLKNAITHPCFIAQNSVEALCMIKGINGFSKIEPSPQIILFSIYDSEIQLINFVKQLESEELCKDAKIFVLADTVEERSRIRKLQLNLRGCIIKPVVFNKFIRTSSLDNFDLYMELTKL
jgi:DNA-binding NarL/FixJ family response regulator